VPSAASAFEAGDTAVVSADGDNLNLRAGPGINEEIVAKLPDGTPVTITSAEPVRASGRDWVSVSTGLGDGWVAAQYLERTDGPIPAAGTRSLPLMQYRMTVPLLVVAN
jgi:uncharacterized protein YraI